MKISAIIFSLMLMFTCPVYGQEGYSSTAYNHKTPSGSWVRNCTPTIGSSPTCAFSAMTSGDGMYFTGSIPTGSTISLAGCAASWNTQIDSSGYYYIAYATSNTASGCTVTATISPSGTNNLVGIEFTGTLVTVDPTFNSSNIADNTYNTTFTTPSITTTQNGDYIVFSCANSSGYTYSAPTTGTMRNAGTSDFGIGDYQQLSYGAVSTTLTQSSGAAATCATVGFKTH